jgi:hypothetical protein
VQQVAVCGEEGPSAESGRQQLVIAVPVGILQIDYIHYIYITYTIHRLHTLHVDYIHYT